MKSKTTLWRLLKDYKIVIPLIQRDYAQGRRGKEYIRSSFLKQIKDCLDNKKELTLDFVYGNIENGSFQPLDGQQRLTTLLLILNECAQKSKSPAPAPKYTIFYELYRAIDHDYIEKAKVTTKAWFDKNIDIIKETTTAIERMTECSDHPLFIYVRI